MKKATLIAIAAAATAGCAAVTAPAARDQAGWITLIDGERGIENFNRLGSANWRAQDGAIVADRLVDKAPGYLVTKSSYVDFEVRAEFWASDDANSGVFLRCQNPAAVSERSCYEANIFDRRPDPIFGTGAIVGVAKVSPMPTAGGRWNTYEIRAQGKRLTLVLNGRKTAEAEHGRFAAGPLALQYGAGVIKWRKVQIRPL